MALGTLGFWKGAVAQSTSVTFQADMSYQIAAGLFAPASEFVDVAGTFNNWGSPVLPLTDPDGDAIYELTVAGLSVGEAIEFKFRLNGQWDGREEFPGAGNNRRYTIQLGANVIRVWYNDQRPPTGPPVAAFASSSQSVVESGFIDFVDRSGGKVTGWQWTFEGGVPQASTEREVTVRYPHPGTYDVTLIATGPEGQDTLVTAGYVEVQTRPDGSTAWWNDAVFYEVFVRSFYDSDGDGVGDFNGLTAKLDYLNDGNPATTDDLGVTGLWLMPIHPSPSTHGYDVTNYYAVNPDYGSMADFRRFLDEAHARGIRVVVDFVMNHSSNQHPWFQASARGEAPYRDFYRWSGSDPGQRGPWGQDVWHRGARGHYYGLFWSGMPDLNYETTAVQDSIFAAADFWLRDVGVDGFRLDAVKYVFEDGASLEDLPATHQFWGAFTDHIRQAAPEAYTVCEAWTQTADVIPYVASGGFSSCFEFDLAAAILAALSTGDARSLAGQMQEVYGAYPYLRYATFLTNHDQDRVFGVLGQDAARARAAAALLLTFPGTPFLYYGEEIGLTGANSDGTNRRPMQWSGEAHAGFTTATPWFPVSANFSAYNVALAEGDSSSLLHAYRRFIGLRNEHPALRTGDYYPVASSNPSLLAFMRVDKDERILVLVNTSALPLGAVRLGLPPDLISPGSYALTDLLDPDHPLTITADALGEVPNVSAGSYGVHVYAFGGLETPVEEEIAEPLMLTANRPNPAHSSTSISFVVPEATPVTVEVFNTLGQRVWERRFAAPTPYQQYTVELDTRLLSPGLYAYRLRQNGQQVTRWMTVVR